MPPARRARQNPIAPYTGVPAPDRRLTSSFTKRSKGAPAAVARIGIVGAYSPSTAAAAAHARALHDGLHDEPGDLAVKVVRVMRDAGESPAESAPGVVHDLPATEEADNQAAARVLNEFDLVVIEHDFGVYGGPDGEQVLKILEWICVPVVVVLHTVPANPTAARRAILAELVRSVDAVVTLSEADRQRAHEHYQVGLRKVLVIDSPDRDEAGAAARHRDLFNALLRRPSAPSK